MIHQPKQEIISEDGFIYRLKRPLHKQALFWTTLIAGIIIFFLTLISVLLLLTTIGLVTENDHLREQASYTRSSLDGYTVYSFGESAEFPSGLKMTVLSVSVDRNRHMSDESTGVAVVASITIENTSQKTILVSPYDFGLYDKEENVYILDGSTFDNTQIGMNIASGKKITVDLIFDGESGNEAPYSLIYDNAKWSK